MLYLQKAKTKNAKKWLNLVDQSRIQLEQWMPHLKRINTIEQAKAYIQKNAPLDFYLGAHIFEIWAEKTLVGLISLHSGRVTKKSAQVAYWLGAAYRGNGYAIKACQSLISKALMEHPIQTIFIHCLVNNLPSKNLATRLGFELIKQENKVLRFAMPKEKWFANYHDENYLFNFLEEID